MERESIKKLQWYYYFSWWIFIWFLLFKSNLTNISPYPIYLLIFIFVIIKLIKDSLMLLLNKEEQTIKYKDTLVVYLLILLVVDILPFLLLRYSFTKKSLLVTSLLSIMYIIFIILSNKNLIKLYGRTSLPNLGYNYSVKSLLWNMF